MVKPEHLDTMRRYTRHACQCAQMSVV
jgi:hypothetical protein